MLLRLSHSCMHVSPASVCHASELLQELPAFLVQAAGLTGYLSDPSKVFTLFAPDNISWQSFFQGVWCTGSVS